MIDAHLASLAWYCAVTIAVMSAVFFLGAVWGIKMNDRQWQERVKWMRKR